MKKLSYVLGSGTATLAMALGVVLPASASAAVQYNDCGAYRASVDCSNVYVDKSRYYDRSLGNGSAIINNYTKQYQTTTTTTLQENKGFGVGVGIGGDASSSSTSKSFFRGGDSWSGAIGGDGTGVGINSQSNSSQTNVTSTQNGGVWFGN